METINYQNFRIEAENICVDYNGKVALYDANLRLKPGQICGLVGMNGAGKTTFFNALTGFVNISKGKIRINGESVRSAQKDQTIAYVPQNEGIDSQFPINVWDVVMMGRYGSMNIFRCPRESDVQAVKDAIERVDLTDHLSTPIGNLSGGQRKRTFLARAIAQRASILLLDEPFSGVDIRSEKLISELFIQFKNEGKTILLSTHDMIHVREFCDLVLLINKTVVAYGETSEVFTPENITTTFGGISKINVQISSNQMINMNEETFYEGGPAKSDLIINLLAGITILGLPFTFAAIVRALWLRYKITNKRITIEGGWFGKNKTQVSLSNIEEIRSIPRGFGSYGDMVLILNDGSKVEMKSLPLFREKQKFIEENINKRSQIPNLNEVEGFATKS